VKQFFLSGAAMGALALAAPAGAQVSTAEAPPAAAATQARRATTYDAAFFAPFAPRSALDIARRVPGFQIDQGNSDIRGFAGAAGNVVFNGARPSSKSESLETLLARIPARRVIRVELGPGDLYGSEYSGKSQVLNVILSAGSGLDGSMTASARRLWTGLVVPNLSGTVLLKRGDASYGLSAGTGRQDTQDEGTDTLTIPATGELVEFRRKRNHYRPHSPYVSANFALEQAPDKAIHLNGRLQRDTEDFIQTNHVFRPGEPDRDDRLFMDVKAIGVELGGDVSRPLAGGAIKLVALANRRHRETLDTVLERTGGVVGGGFEQGTESQRNETIGRLNWTRADLAGFSVETGAEVSLNTLDYHLDLFVLGSGGARTRLDLPLDDATVREVRGEIYAKAGRALSPNLRVDAGINVEASRLKVRGDTTADRSLTFLKPSVTLDWKPGGGWHSQLTVRRTVAQLDFFDFISAAELSNSRVNGGNANLLPQRAWEVRATLDRPLFGTGLIKLDAGIDRISLLQDRILTDEGFDAPGNIGTGKRAFAALAIDAPLDRLAKGVRLKLNGQVQRTRVLDPISGETRSFTGFFPNWQWSAELRRDIGKFAYGGQISDRAHFAFYRADEIDDNKNLGPYATAFVEYRPSDRTTVTFDVDNLLSTKGVRNRTFSFPNRSNPIPGLHEYRERNSHRAFTLTVKRTFGGGAKTAA
jgi:hypothetical protein